MLINPEIIEDKFICNKFLADYLVQKIPLLGVKNGEYYFAKTKEFYNIINNLPIIYKIYNVLFSTKEGILSE